MLYLNRATQAEGHQQRITDLLVGSPLLLFGHLLVDVEHTRDIELDAVQVAANHGPELVQAWVAGFSYLQVGEEILFRKASQALSWKKKAGNSGRTGSEYINRGQGGRQNTYVRVCMCI